MKYLIIVADGSADDEIEELGGKTPLEVARLENINNMAALGEVGTLRTVPEGIAPGSDAANLAVLGYDPKKYLTGRSPLEAASIGLHMTDDQLAFRANLVTLDDRNKSDYEDFIITDHSAGDLTTDEAKVLMADIAKAFNNETMSFYAGTGYRECLIMDKTTHIDCYCTPPHDILDKRVGDYMPKGNDSHVITRLMKESYEILKDHPVNLDRIKRGLNPANSLWIWGQGVKPAIPDIRVKYEIDGPVISAVDLIKGIGIFAGLYAPEIPGATGNLNTNYGNKAQKAIEEFQKGKNFAYIHVEAPDECSHQGNLKGKIQSVEDIDSKIVKPIYKYLSECGDDFRIMILPDHRTPIRIRTHSSDPIPFVIYDSRKKTEPDLSKQFNEKSGLKADNHYENGYELADYFFEKVK